MRYLFACLLAWLAHLSVLCQSDTASDSKTKVLKEASIHLGAFFTPLSTQYAWGINYNLGFYFTSKFSVGLSLSHASRKMNQDFDYTIADPIIYYYEFGLTSQYDFLKKKNLKMAVNLNQGMSISELGDDSIQVEYTTSNGKRLRALLIDKSTFYLLEPGTDFLYRLFAINGLGNMYLNVKLKYRWVIGNTSHGTQKDFNGPYWGLGLTLGDLF